MADSAGDRRLPRGDRLRSRRDFERLSREGERRASRHFLILLSRRPRRGRDAAGSRPRLGVTASRKVGGSVLRSRVKRCIRAAFRAERDVLPRGSDVVVIARQGAGALGGNEVAAELAALFRGGAAR